MHNHISRSLHCVKNVLNPLLSLQERFEYCPVLDNDTQQLAKIGEVDQIITAR